jgi:hypothetical protein
MASCEEVALAMNSAPVVERVTMYWSILIQETCPLDIMAMKPKSGRSGGRHRKQKIDLAI